MLLAACCTAALLAGTPPPYPAWEPLAEALRPSVEIDRRRIVRDRGFVEVWVRTRGEPAAVAREFAAAGEPDETVARVRTALGHSEHLWSFQCEDRTHALAVSAYWATDGSPIRRFDVTRRAYWPVQPDTVGQRLLRAACGPADRDTLARDGAPSDDDSRSDEASGTPLDPGADDSAGRHRDEGDTPSAGGLR
ncbi:MAG: hypothetical protein EHM87_16395 [Burkholderiales bacterium]|nr:MAG: hypothetical protein EHM87_16395 [Burkholderiales bacterium]